jgi:hypothetical protein
VGEQNGLGSPASIQLDEQLVDEPGDIGLRIRRVEPDPPVPFVAQAIIVAGEETGGADGLLRGRSGCRIEVDGA